MNYENIVCKAILEKRQISFFYDGEYRILEPHAYGMRHGSPRLMAFQIGGHSTGDKSLGWRQFDLDKAGYFRLLQNKFYPKQIKTPENWSYRIAVVR